METDPPTLSEPNLKGTNIITFSFGLFAYSNSTRI